MTKDQLLEEVLGLRQRVSELEALVVENDDLQNFFRVLVEKTSDGLAVLGAEGNIRYASPSVETIMGYRPEEVISRNAFDFLHPETGPKITSLFKRALKNKGRLGRSWQNCRHKDGSWRMLDVRVFNLLHYPAVCGVLLNFRDITVRRQVQEALKEREASYRSLVQNIPGVVYQFLIKKDKSCSIPYISENCYDLLGLTQDEIQADPSSFWALLPPEGIALAKQKIAESAQGMTKFTMDIQLRKPGGEIRWLHGESTPQALPSGDILWNGVAIDITARKEAEKAREKFVSELEEAFTKVKQLSGLLPICASCKKIRDDQGYWKQLEEFISDHSEAEFTHGICPECAKKLYPSLFPEKHQ
ncbi:MAG: PAS domain S-box protein [Deltaproteobacteria bacterium]|nr:PAS domain S-box protein [Deltaproteobacteria bacterium]